MAMRDKKPQIYFYYFLALIGLAIPWYFNLAYLIAGGSFAPAPFLAAVSANPLTAGITWDVYLAALTFSVCVWQDAPKRKVSHPWLFIAACLGIGLAFAFPLYLARREVANQA
jgi:hypothetical protein